ncbi:MAG TPA: HEAT repeat domain-containing protein [Robiginitalea sp.]|nr:HEAT repeat domain-containing protein [Robiginitalea sp.]
MNIRPLTYRLFSWLQTPRIQTELLWELVLLFAGLGGVYLLLIFWMRNRISARREAIRLHKRDLAPMISNFLFYQHESEAEDRDTYIRMKIEIREMLKVPLNREVMTEVLMDLRMDVSGDARERLFQLFQDLELHQDSFRKLDSWRWERVSKGILELTEMQVETAYPFIRKFINDRRSVIRKQAQLATVMLREEGIAYCLDTAHFGISEWQQLKLLEILRLREDYSPPRFRVWLTSENRDVVLFALRLIRYYRQNDAETALITLLGHRNRKIKGAALECIREFRFVSALEPIKELFSGANEELKLLILDTIGLIGSERELGFLEQLALHDANFIIRSKARAVMNLLKPDSVLPQVAHQESGENNEPAHAIRQEAPSHPDLELPFEEPVAQEPVATERFVLWEPAFPEDEIYPAADSVFDPVKGTAPAHRMADQGHEPEWEEDEAIFDICFLEELEDILSGLDPADEPEGILPLDFLPIIIDPSPGEAAAAASPEELEVVAEQVAPEPARRVSGPDRRQDLKEDFLPWIVSEPSGSDLGFDKTPPAPPAAYPGSPPDGPAHFWEPIFELDELPQPADASDGEPCFAEASRIREEALQHFSIFRELFRHYDVESKLILLEQIEAVGEKKEWAFLHEVLEDPEPEIARKASQVIEELGRRLGLENAGLDHSKEPTPGEQSEGENPVFQLHFAPESNQDQTRPEKKASRAIRTIRRPWLPWARNRKKQTHG